jgi:hypothetical protein
LNEFAMVVADQVRKGETSLPRSASIIARALGLELWHKRALLRLHEGRRKARGALGLAAHPAAGRLSIRRGDAGNEKRADEEERTIGALRS